MKHHVTLYTPVPDYGDRFARMWLAYHNPPSRWNHTAAIVAGAVAGVAMAWGMVL